MGCVIIITIIVKRGYKRATKDYQSYIKYFYGFIGYILDACF